MLNCRLKVISPYNHGSSKVERKIKTVSDIIVKHLWDKGQLWPLFLTTAAYAIHSLSTTFISIANQYNEVLTRFHWPIIYRYCPRQKPLQAEGCHGFAIGQYLPCELHQERFSTHTAGHSKYF